MKPKSLNRNLLGTAMTLAFSLSLLVSSAQAATWTGLGGDANWGTAANWDTPIANSFSTALVFGGSTQTTNTNNLTGGTATSLTFASGASAFTLGGNSFTLSGGASALTNSSAVTQTINNNLVLANAAQTFALTSGGLTLGGAVSAAGTASGVTLTGGNILTVNATGTLAGTGSAITLGVTAGQRLVIGSGATVTGSLNGGSAVGGFLQFTDATSTLIASSSGTRSFAGTITGAGTLVVNVTGGQRQDIGSNMTGFTGVLEFRQGESRHAPLAAGGYTVRLNGTTGTNSTGVYTNGGGAARAINIDVTGNGGYYRFNGGTETLSGTVTGSGQLNLRLNNGSGYNLTGNWSGFTGTLQLSNSTGFVNINTTNSSNSSAAYDLAISGSILQTGAAITANLGSLTGIAGTTLRGNVAGTSTFSIGGRNTSTTFAGAVTNGTTVGTMITAVTKVGTGTLTLSGTNTYNGATTINGGNLAVTGSIASATTVNTGGKLSGTGTVGDITVASNGSLAPGVSTTPATLTTGAATFNNGSIFSWDVNANGSAYDKITNSGLVDGGAAGGSIFQIVVADATFSAANGWNTTKTWTDVFSSTGTGLSTLFTSFQVVDSSFNTVTVPNGGGFSFSGNTLTYSPVPEPSTALAGLLLGAGLLRRRRVA